jgi:hypothetical protein
MLQIVIVFIFEKNFLLQYKLCTLSLSYIPSMCRSFVIFVIVGLQSMLYIICRNVYNESLFKISWAHSRFNTALVIVGES